MSDPKNDPDETEGRKLYRAKADALANAQVSIAQRSVKLSEQVGWFVWGRALKGVPTRSKVLAGFYPSSFPETRKNQLANELAKFPLNEEEWNMGLDVLAVKYPCPVKLEPPKKEGGDAHQ